MDDEEEEPELKKHTVSQEDILSQVGSFEVPQHHDIIPLSIIACIPLSIIACQFSTIWKNFCPTSSGLGKG